MTFRYLTSGESHGQSLTAVIEGVPSGIWISKDFIDSELKRRQTGYGRGNRMNIEKDKALIKAGIRHGFTTGAPICLEILNKDWENWTIAMAVEPQDLKNPEVEKQISEKKITKVRPGHADLAGALKYNHEDIRNILERSSARETAARVAVGAIAKSILDKFDIEIFSHVLSIGDIKTTPDENLKEIKELAEKSELRCTDEIATEKMKAAIDKAKEKGVSLGGTIQIIALNLPVGLGSFVHWDRRLDGLLAQALMSIPAVKSVEIGLGKESAFLEGDKIHDEIYPKENEKYIRKTNNAGGIEGGMSNGSPLVIEIAMKPIPTMQTPLNSIDLETNKAYPAHFERADVCAVPACGVVAEAMVANVLASVFLEKFGGDSFDELLANYQNYCSMVSKR